ncbi:glycosyltransferase [soil metagenome]
MRRKILIVISNIDYSLGFEWLASYTDKSRFELIFVFLNQEKPTLVKIVEDLGLQVWFLKYSGKKNIPSVAFQLYKIIRKIKPDTIHTHLFDASLIALPISRLAGIKQRIYTRHHSTYHHVYHPSMVKYDRFINNQCTQIVAISDNVSQVLIDLENVPSEKIVLIHHGFEIEKFGVPDLNQVNRLKANLKVAGKYPVIGVISRYTEWKGVQFIIPAFKELLVVYPDAKLILANANGDYKKEITTLLRSLPDGSYAEIAFEKDIFSLYALFDIFVHVPVDSESEAFGQTYIESLAAGVSSIFTLSGIAREFITHEKNAWVVPFKNSEEIYSSFVKILANPELAKKIQVKGKADVKDLFPVKIMIQKLEELYAAGA